MGRQGLMDDAGYHEFDECCKYDECCGEAYEKGVYDGRVEAIDELLYYVGEKLAGISMNPAERAELYALFQIKANEIKGQKNE